ncbi:hypothetical protein HYN48_14215 [Flavobacterium magnum]|uniref:Lipoprotein n=1 Tax=Flavobacterium magnum TaxID=2162713 RepID=A0A2S0RHK0_9FLAO|nr:hypothetical protein [Flavobacterium magnum]AWA31154.1 hypothetical protein HYN48_14215 [Flavobacterium magnum]
MKKYILLSTLALFISCRKTAEENAIEFQPNKNLIDFKITHGLNEDEVYKLNDDQLQYLNSEKFNPKTDTIMYKKNELYISYLTFMTSGPEYRGDFKIKGDSLLLEIIPFADYALTEQMADRIVFKIANNENKKFKIKKGI